MERALPGGQPYEENIKFLWLRQSAIRYMVVKYTVNYRCGTKSLSSGGRSMTTIAVYSHAPYPFVFSTTSLT